MPLAGQTGKKKKIKKNHNFLKKTQTSVGWQHEKKSVFMQSEILLQQSIGKESPIAAVGYSVGCLSLPPGSITASKAGFRALPLGMAVGKQDQHICNKPHAL